MTTKVLNRETGITSCNSCGLPIKQDTGEVRCCEKCWTVSPQVRCINRFCPCHSPNMTEVMGSDLYCEKRCFRCFQKYGHIPLLKDCEHSPMTEEIEQVSDEELDGAVRRELAEEEGKVIGNLGFTEKNRNAKLENLVIGNEAPNTEAYPLMEADSEGMMRHKCCEHCEENGHAPHSRGCPNTEASEEFDEELIRLIGITYTTAEEQLAFYDKLKALIHTEREKAREETWTDAIDSLYNNPYGEWDEKVGKTREREKQLWNGWEQAKDKLKLEARKKPSV